MFIHVIGTRPNRWSASPKSSAERGWVEAYVARSASSSRTSRSRFTVLARGRSGVMSCAEVMCGRCPQSHLRSTPTALEQELGLPYLVKRSFMPEPRRRQTPYAVTVRRTERLSASMTRVVVGGPALAAFAASPCADSYVKVVFVHPD